MNLLNHFEVDPWLAARGTPGLLPDPSLIINILIRDI